MKEKTTRFNRMKDLPSTHILGAGTAMCAGCGALQAIKQVIDVLGENTVFVNAAGCMTLMSIYPFSPFKGSWLYTAMASAPAGAQGIRDALDILMKQKKIPRKEDLQVVVLAGDGSANGIGLSAASGAIDRNLDFIYLCYDNEGYGNTGQQFSSATPHGARTATSTGPSGYQGYKKDLFSVWAAHQPTYVATIVGSEPLDLARKVEKAKQLSGPRLFIALSPCPTGWNFEPEDTVKIGKSAVKTGIWPLKEYYDGHITHTKFPSKRALVEEYLSLQGRFDHLFKPSRNEALIAEIQQKVDSYWENTVL